MINIASLDDRLKSVIPDGNRKLSKGSAASSNITV